MRPTPPHIGLLFTPCTHQSVHNSNDPYWRTSVHHIYVSPGGLPIGRRPSTCPLKGGGFSLGININLDNKLESFAKMITLNLLNHIFSKLDQIKIYYKLGAVDHRDLSARNYCPAIRVYAWILLSGLFKLTFQKYIKIYLSI